MKIGDYKIGDKAEISHQITEEDLERFVALTGDDNPLHVDAEFARHTSFRKPVAHGMLGASFISTIIGTKLPGKGALWFSQSLEFLLPVMIGDKLKITAEVVAIHERQNYLELRTDVFNQKRQKVIGGLSKVRLIEQSILNKKVIVKKKKRINLIFGATGDVGSAVADLMTAEDQVVIIQYHTNESRAKALVKELNVKKIEALAIKADITDQSQVEDMFNSIGRKYGYLTSVVNCATPGMDRLYFMDTTWQDFQTEIDVQLRGAVNIVKNAVALMDKDKYGKLVFLTTLAIEQPSVNMSTYIAAKSALNGFAKAIALELAPKGIRVNMVSPGMIDGNLNYDVPEKIRLLTAAKTPLKNLVTSKDVARAIQYLISEESDMLTGETIRVNGGQMML